MKLIFKIKLDFNVKNVSYFGSLGINIIINQESIYFINNNKQHYSNDIKVTQFPNIAQLSKKTNI